MGRLASTFGALLGRRQRVVAAGVVVLTVALGFGLPRLAFDTSEEGLINKGSKVWEDNRRYQGTFGGEAMLVLWTGDIHGLLDADHLARVRDLEAELRDTGQFNAVLGPYGALMFADAQVKHVATDMIIAAVQREQAAGRDAVAEALYAEGAAEAARMGAIPAAEQTLDNPAWARFLLFDAAGEIRPILRDNFPDLDHAMMVVRLPGNADIGELGPGSKTVQRLVHEHALPGFDVVAAGSPTLLTEINDYLQGGMATLGLFAVGVMVLILFLVFRVRWRLVPLGAVVIGTVWAFGILGYLGISLTMVTISGLPIFLGLGVDFAIQMQNRFEEEIHLEHPVDAAVRRTLRFMAPPLLVAMGGAVAGFLALRISRVPMIREFSVMLVVGTITLVAVAITLPVSVLAWREITRPTTAGTEAGPRLLERAVGRSMRVARPVIVPLALVSVAVAAMGLVVDGRFKIETEPEKWVSPTATSVRDIEKLWDGAKFSTELGVLVEADDVTRTDVVQWMQQWAARQVEQHPAEIVRTTSLPAIAASVHGVAPVQADIEAVLSVAPPDVVRSFVNADHTRANIIFPIHPISLNAREALLKDMVADLDPPAGVTATPSGLAVVGMELVDNLQANRQTMTIVALVGVLLWLLLLTRSITRSLLPLIPVALSVGLTTLVLYLLGIVMTPLTTVSGPMAIAVTTEFSVLLMYRYVEERAAGRSPAVAVDGCRRIGRAFVASGLTLLGGFGVLMLSPLPLLIDFGVVIAVIVVVALLCALVVMPPLLVWMDEHQHFAVRVPRLEGMRREDAASRA
jgi:hydrophobe/amphiphile efflux-3 (HAE3) family protein